MMFKRCERQRSHTVITMTATALSIIGALTVVSLGKAAVTKIKAKISTIAGKMMPSCLSSDDSEESQQY